MEIQNQKGKKVQQVKQQVQLNAAQPSSSSSPEFSFTISHHPTATKIPHDENKPHPTSSTVDLSPADEIFFHGHLLPLHHIPSTSPRSSANSIDNFTLPLNELSHENHNSDSTGNNLDGRGRKKSNTFSIFGSKWRKEEMLGSKWRKEEKGHRQNEEKRKSKFEALKRYIRLVKPFIHSLRNRNIKNPNLIHHQPYSYSGNLRLKKSKKELRVGYSAPASMRNSPTNSGRLVASGSLTPIKTSNDSTMEELQAAIQAAIAHCKNSIATQDQCRHD